MKGVRSVATCLLAVMSLAAAAPVFGQIVINEIVKEQRTAGAGAVTPDAREYVELFNAGDSPINIGNWTLSTYRLSGTVADAPGTYFFTDTITAGTVLNPGDYYVLGASGVPNLDQDLGSGFELWEDLRATVMELRRGPVDTAPIEDAVAYDRFFANGTPPAGVTFVSPTPEQAAQTGRGVWGQVQSYDIPETADFKRLSLSRYRDGRDSNINGLDFGFLPMTPGTTNNVLPENTAHNVPDVSTMTPGTQVTAYNYAFIPARVANPAVVDALGSGTPPRAINPKQIPNPPQGGNVIVAWDESGGGNAVYSKELVTSFDIYAYLDATPLALGTGDWEMEATAYGIGTTDPLFGTPNSSGIQPATTINTQNSSTGIGWLYERGEKHPDDGGGNVFNLSLVDFGQGGNSIATGTEYGWEIIESFDLTGNTGWHRLSIDYDPDTGEVVARFGDEEVMFTADPDLLGTFYAGYREAMTGVPGTNAGKARPPTFVEFVATATPGDHDGNGVVDARDYVVWRKNPGAFGPNAYNEWKANFGAGSGGGSGSVGSVPEPGSAALVVFGLLLAAAQRGRKR